MFTSEELVELSERASSIDERLDGSYVAINRQYSSEKAEKRLKMWCNIATDGDKKLFRKRLERDGLDIEVVKSLIGDARLNKDESIPHWVETFSWVLEAMISRVGENPKTSFIQYDKPQPFEELFVPLIIAAQVRRNRITGSKTFLFTETAHGDLQRYLLQKLSELCAPTLQENFLIFRMVRQPMFTVFNMTNSKSKTCNDYYAFIDELRTDEFRDYFLNRPVLARLLATIVQQWIEVTAEIIIRLSADLVAIYETFNYGKEPCPVINVDYGLSDPHNGGRTVCILTFADGLKIVYKPKDLGLHVAWCNLLNWLDKMGAPVSATAPIVLKRQGYGWVQWIKSKPCGEESDVKQFYQHAGSMLCLIQLLQGTDFHFENVIACGKKPVLVDMETLMHPWLYDQFSTSDPRFAFVVAKKILRDSVLSTGYLPNWVIVPGGQSAGVGGLNPVEFREIKRWRFMDVNTDSMKMNEVSESVEITTHLPSFDRKRISSISYYKEIVLGFEMMYRFVLNNRHTLIDPNGPIDSFRGLTLRVVLRPTRLYALLLRRSLECKNLSDGIDWSMHFDFLSRFSTWDDGEDRLLPMLAAERRSLTQLDIPFFTTRTDMDGLQLHNNNTIAKYAEKSSFDQTVSRLKNLSERGMQNQTKFILQALKIAESNSKLEKNEPWNQDSNGNIINNLLTQHEAVNQAQTFADFLKRSAVCAGGGATWIGAVTLPRDGRAQLDVIGYDLYSGACGVALFLSALDFLTGERNYRHLALSALAPLRRELQDCENRPRLARGMGIGGGTGIGSVIYVLSKIGKLLNDQGLIEDARNAATMITTELINEDRFLDVLGGTAGAILGLLAFYNVCQDASIMKQLNDCGQHLITKQGEKDIGSKGWKTVNGKLLTGFSHGAAGISLALLKLYEATGNFAFYNAACNGIEYERSVFSEEEENWPDFRKHFDNKNVVTYPCQWCHGAPGIGLARLSSLNILDDYEIRNEINIALKTTKAFPMGILDHLCCGNFGRLELLFSAGLRLGKSEYVDIALYRAFELLNRAKEIGGFRWRSGTDAQNPSFFTGISGVGYQLLRLTHPDILQSILLWE